MLRVKLEPQHLAGSKRLSRLHGPFQVSASRGAVGCGPDVSLCPEERHQKFSDHWSFTGPREPMRGQTVLPKDVHIFQPLEPVKRSLRSKRDVANAVKSSIFFFKDFIECVTILLLFYV